MTEDDLLPYHEHVPQLAARMAEQGSLGILLLDASPIAAIEHDYGTEAYQEVRQRFVRVFLEQRGRDYRTADLVAVDRPGGLRFVIFLDRKRRQSLPFTPADLRAARNRVAPILLPHLSRAQFPYHRGAAPFEMGAALAIHNPLLQPERILRRAFDEAGEAAALHRQTESLASRERLQDVIIRDRIITAFQPILKLPERTVLGFEALTRGARGTGLETADALFGTAARHGLMLELDRLCRSRALRSSGRIPSNAKIFINTLPATIRDPQFRGRPLITFLDNAQVSPDRIVIEITEKLVIENYALFRETMAYFTDLGMKFAVDDVGAGYSGLESIARLKPSFLKIDMTLVRDVNISLVNREMVKAIVSMGHGIGALVIAEGIHTEEETNALEAMGVDYGQGYYLARPDAGPE